MVHGPRGQIPSTATAATTPHVLKAFGPTFANGDAGDDIINVGSRNPKRRQPELGPRRSDGRRRPGLRHLQRRRQRRHRRNTGQLSAAALTGLGMSPGITYSALEAVNVALGSGNDTFTVAGTMPRGPRPSPPAPAATGDRAVRVRRGDRPRRAGRRHPHGGHPANAPDPARPAQRCGCGSRCATPWTSTAAPARTAYIVNITRGGRLRRQRPRHGRHGDRQRHPDGLRHRGGRRLPPAGEHERRRRSPSWPPCTATRTATVERINYNKNLDNLVSDTRGGDDRASLDDNWTPTTVYGGIGRGQLPGRPDLQVRRDAASAGVAPHDEFETIVTTRGFLSNGVSYTDDHQRRRRQRHLRGLPQHRADRTVRRQRRRPLHRPRLRPGRLADLDRRAAGRRRPRPVRPQRPGRHRGRRRQRHRPHHRHRVRRRVRHHRGRGLRRRRRTSATRRSRGSRSTPPRANDTFYVLSTDPASRPSSTAASAATASTSRGDTVEVDAGRTLGVRQRGRRRWGRTGST